jgi:hypothetical protein
VCGLSDPHAAALMVRFDCCPSVLFSALFPTLLRCLLEIAAVCSELSEVLHTLSRCRSSFCLFSEMLLSSSILSLWLSAAIVSAWVSTASGVSRVLLLSCLSHISSRSICPLADRSRNLRSASFTCGVTRSSQARFCRNDIRILVSIGTWKISLSLWAVFISRAYRRSILALISFSARDMPWSTGEELSWR